MVAVFLKTDQHQMCPFFKANRKRTSEEFRFKVLHEATDHSWFHWFYWL